jgi:hypothetical protein
MKGLTSRGRVTHITEKELNGTPNRRWGAKGTECTATGEFSERQHDTAHRSVRPHGKLSATYILLETSPWTKIRLLRR